MRRYAFFLLIFLSTIAPLAAGDDIQAVNALWSKFVQALASGQYKQAHSLFSPESRSALPFGEFVVEYGPVSAARELVLAKTENVSTSLNGDWAELTYGGHRAGTGRPFAVGVAMVKNSGEWGLVAARNEAPESLEAGARALLRSVATVRGQPNAGTLVRELLARESGNPVLTHYRFDTDGELLKAVPVAQGLRPFHVDSSGAVHPGLEPAPVPAAPPSVPEPAEPAQPRPVMVDGLPELGEPPPPPGFGSSLPPLAPPPLSPVFDGSGDMLERLPDPDKFTLPDRIE